MNYEYGIQNTYRINTSVLTLNSVTIFKNDGTTGILSSSLLNNTYTYANICQKVCDNGYGGLPYLFNNGLNCYLVTPTHLDYWIIQNSSSDSEITIRSKELNNNGNDENTILSNGSTYDLYLFEPSGVYLDALGRYSSVDVVLNDDEALVFDYQNTWYPQDSRYYNYQAKQFNSNGTAYYYYQVYLEIVKDEFITFSTGLNRDVGAYDYLDGYSNGYNDGLNVGYREGYDVGISVDRNTANAFSYIEQTFNAIGGIMQLEVIPHVTLGLCFSIPLVIVLIMTIFKLVKK